MAAALDKGQKNWSRLFGCSELAHDEDVALSAVTLDWEAAGYISAALRSDSSFMRRAISLNGLVIQLTPSLCEQQIHGLCAVRQNGLALRFLSHELQADAKIVREAVANNPMALEFASEGLRSQRDIVLSAVVKHGHALQFASDQLKEDRTLLLTAARRYLFIDWQWLFDSELRNSKAAALGAVHADAAALRCLAPEWCDDREVVLAAVQQEGVILELAADELKADRDIVKAAVRSNGRALQMAAAELRSDRGVLSSAARRWWSYDWSVLEDSLVCDRHDSSVRSSQSCVSLLLCNMHNCNYRSNCVVGIEII